MGLGRRGRVPDTWSGRLALVKTSYRSPLSNVVSLGYCDETHVAGHGLMSLRVDDVVLIMGRYDGPEVLLDTRESWIVLTPKGIVGWLYENELRPVQAGEPRDTEG